MVAGAPVLLRRSRGFVPRPIQLARPVARPVLACGAQLKNTFCLAAGDVAVLGPHVGDLDQLEVHRSYEESIDRMQRFLGCRPEVVAYDLHPDYASTRYALDRPETVKVAVQHHHAHVASAIADHGLDGPVIGVAFDGTGYGTDGSAWGGEFLVASASAFQRIATLHPIRAGRRRARHPRAVAHRRSRCSSTRTTGTRPGSGTSPPSPRMRRCWSARRSPWASTRPRPTGWGGSSTASVRWCSAWARPGTRARWRWPGTWSRPRSRTGATPSRSTPAARCWSWTSGRWCGR